MISSQVILKALHTTLRKDFGAVSFPLLEFRRWRKNPLPTHPKHANWARLQLLEMGKPEYPIEHPTTENLWMDCSLPHESIIKEQRNAVIEIQVLYAKELSELMETSCMVGIYHSNLLKYHPNRKAWQNARRLGMETKCYKNITCKKVFTGSKWETLNFFIDNGMEDQRFTFSKTFDPKALLSYEKKVPEFIFMAALIDGKLYDRAGVTRLINLPSIDILHGQLSTLLQMSAQKTLRLLQTNQQNLATNLSQYVLDQSKKIE